MLSTNTLTTATTAAATATASAGAPTAAVPATSAGGDTFYILLNQQVGGGMQAHAPARLPFANLFQPMWMRPMSAAFGNGLPAMSAAMPAMSGALGQPMSAFGGPSAVVIKNEDIASGTAGADLASLIETLDPEAILSGGVPTTPTTPSAITASAGSPEQTSSNTATVAPTEADALGQEIGEGLLALHEEGHNKLGLRVNHPEYGDITMQVSFQGTQASVSVTSADPAVRAALELSSESLRSTFEAAGFQLSSVDVKAPQFALGGNLLPPPAAGQYQLAYTLQPLEALFGSMGAGTNATTDPAQNLVNDFA